jgi:two-component system, OmpR family, sensor histidine kinase VicK
MFYTYKFINRLDGSLTNAASSNAVNGRTEVLHGEQNVINTVLQFTSNAENTIDACVDYTRPSLVVEIERLRKAFLAAKSKGVKLRYVTEITDDNISYCKELLKLVNELRHLEGIKGNFYISETEYIAPASLHEKGRPASQIIYSNVKEIVEHQRQFVFDSFWARAIPAEQKIKELEEGIIHYETKVLENKEEIFHHMKSIIEKASERSVVSSIGGMQLVYNNFFEEYKRIVDGKQRTEGEAESESKGIRWITSIDKDSIELIKIFLNAGIQIRHLKNLTHMNFAVDDRNFYATIDQMENGNFMNSLLTSNEPAYIRHYTSIFEELWKNGIDAIDRIKDIESGVHLSDIEVIPSSTRAQELYLEIVNNASEEILWIFPSINAFIRQERIGAIQLAKDAAKERNVKVRIMIPANSVIEQKIQQLKQYCYPNNTIDVRYIVQMSDTKATILVIDRKASLVMELRDDSKATFIEAIGLSTYSNSKAGVSSYIAIFENLWKQTELYDLLKESTKKLELAYEQLKRHDKMQEEFINIAAHELRTPIQPILGLTQVIRANSKDAKQCELLDVTIRNAKRLHQLTEDILDVTKIESHSLSINKELFNLNDVITNAIKDITSSTSPKISSKTEINTTAASPIKLEYRHPRKFFVLADKGRIIQVINNLLNNAIKFTQKGTISISLESKKKQDGDDGGGDNDYILISVKDTGKGIDPGILPNLFTKFATKSESRGTGLGLFISKNIIESHGGKIWAQNNNDGIGATFSFSLPSTNYKQIGYCKDGPYSLLLLLLLSLSHFSSSYLLTASGG